MRRDPGDKFYACKRKADELQHKDPGSSELVLLKAHMQLANVAKDRWLCVCVLCV